METMIFKLNPEKKVIYLKEGNIVLPLIFKRNFKINKLSLEELQEDELDREFMLDKDCKGSYIIEFYNLLVKDIVLQDEPLDNIHGFAVNEEDIITQAEIREGSIIVQLIKMKPGKLLTLVTKE